jgi:hypothetical protein
MQVFLASAPTFVCCCCWLFPAVSGDSWSKTAIGSSSECNVLNSRSLLFWVCLWACGGQILGCWWACQKKQLPVTSFLEAFELELQLLFWATVPKAFQFVFFLFAQMLGLLSSAKDGTTIGLLFPLLHCHARSRPLIMASFH